MAESNSQSTTNNQTTITVSPVQDAEKIAIEFSKICHEELLSPDYYIKGFENHNQVWHVVETEERIKSVKEFLPFSRLPMSMLVNLYYKAERANQGIMICQVLCNYYLSKIQSKALFYRGQPVIGVELHFLELTGFKTPFIDEFEEYLIDRTLAYPVVKLVLEEAVKIKEDSSMDVNGGISGENGEASGEKGEISGENFQIQGKDRHVYIDLCGPSIEVNLYAENGCPFASFEDVLVEKNKYPNSRDVSIISVGESIKIDSDLFYKAFIEKMSKEHDEEYFVFIEFLYKKFRDHMKKIGNTYANKQRRKNNTDKKRGYKLVPVPEDDELIKMGLLNQNN